MVMGSAWRKNNLRELRRSLGRWLAILAIIALGIGFFAGLKASKPAMLLTAGISCWKVWILILSFNNFSFSAKHIFIAHIYNFR